MSILKFKIRTMFYFSFFLTIKDQKIAYFIRICFIFWLSMSLKPNYKFFMKPSFSPFQFSSCYISLILIFLKIKNYKQGFNIHFFNSLMTNHFVCWKNFIFRIRIYFLLLFAYWIHIIIFNHILETFLKIRKIFLLF